MKTTEEQEAILIYLDYLKECVKSNTFFTFSINQHNDINIAHIYGQPVPSYTGKSTLDFHIHFEGRLPKWKKR